jgi:hypothetical protein
MSPLIAVYGGQRVTVTDGGPDLAQCPGCRSDMRAKRGSIVTHHWAHLPDPSRVCATEPETAWHLGWKNRAAELERIEVAVGRRRADVLTRYGWAVEFQHSPLTPREVAAREKDWGSRLIWVWDALEATESERLTAYHPEGRPFETVRWAWSKAHVTTAKAPSFIHIAADSLLFMGQWYQKRPHRPVIGYGWRLTADEFTEHVINGAVKPRPPGFQQPLDPSLWSVPLNLTACPVCARPYDEPSRCSATAWHRDGAMHQGGVTA